MLKPQKKKKQEPAVDTVRQDVGGRYIETIRQRETPTMRMKPVVVTKPADEFARRLGDAISEQKAEGRGKKLLGRRTSLLGAGLSAWLARHKK